MSAPAANVKYPSQGAAIAAKVAQAVAWVSGLFSLVTCILLIVNQIQIMSLDPLNLEQMKQLRKAIGEDRANPDLREKTQLLQLMARRAFFTNQTYLRAAGALLLGGVAIFLASIKTFVELRLKLPVPLGQAPREGGSADQAAGRWAVAAGAGVVVVTTLFLVFIFPPTFDLEVPAEASKGQKTDGKAPEAPAEPNATPPVEATKPVGDSPAPTPLVAAPEPIPAHAWPAFRGPGGSGVASHKNAPLTWNGKTMDNIAWKVPIPKDGTNSPVVWGNKVFVAGSDDESRDIYAYDTATGKLLWKGETRLVTGALPKVFEGTTYSAPTMATDGERVYAIFATSDIVAFAMDGTKAWARNLGAIKNQYGHTSSLMLYPGRLLVQFDHAGGGHLLVLDSKNGKTVQDVTREVKDSWASPIVVNTGSRFEAILNAKPFVTGHDPATGKLLWKVECMSGEVAPSPAYADGVVFVTTEGAPLVAIKTGGEGAILWKVDEDLVLPDSSSLVAKGKYLLMASAGGMVTCLATATGKKIWTKEFDEGFESSPLIVGDRVYLMDKNGVTVVFKLDDAYEELARNELGEKARCTPAIPDGRIYIRSAKNLYCIGKDAR